MIAKSADTLHISGKVMEKHIALLVIALLADDHHCIWINEPEAVS